MVINERLQEQQNNIINSDSDKIAVFAGPGSGKTYTLIKKIEHDCYELNNYEGVIALSFTVEASNQLKKKLEPNIKNEVFKNSFISTTDSFIMWLIKLYYFKYESAYKEFKVEYASSAENYMVNRECKDEYLKKYIHEWKRNLDKGIYHISFVQYIYGRKILSNPEIVRYLSIKFKHIYIDEAQDLNKWQFNFFNRLADIADIKIMYVGDEKQSLYRFRGAKPEFFISLKNNSDYNIYEITESVRCPENILNFALAYERNERIKIEKFPEIHINKPIDYIKLKENKDSIFLAYTKNACLDIEEKLIKKGVNNVLCVEPIIVDIKDTVKEKQLENLIRYWINYQIMKEQDIRKVNGNKKYIYDNTKNIKNLLGEYNFSEFITIKYAADFEDFVNDVLEIDVRIAALLENSKHKYYYDNGNTINKIMTIHTAKGLEADNVYVKVLDGFQYNKQEVRNMYFVAFTRTKKNLFISCEKYLEKEITKYYT